MNEVIYIACEEPNGEVSMYSAEVRPMGEHKLGVVKVIQDCPSMTGRKRFDRSDERISDTKNGALATLVDAKQAEIISLEERIGRCRIAMRNASDLMSLSETASSKKVKKSK